MGDYYPLELYQVRNNIKADTLLKVCYQYQIIRIVFPIVFPI